jgi:xanthine/uracil/vitamin C permease (AzgA family)
VSVWLHAWVAPMASNDMWFITAAGIGLFLSHIGFQKVRL